MRNSVLLLLMVGGAAYALDAPTALTLVSATNRQVKLSWTAGGAATTQYVVERRSLDGTDYGAAGMVVPDEKNVLATSFTDTGFDPFTAYVYRVRGVNTLPIPAEVSDPTNEVTAGPPPYGYTRVVPTPDHLASPGNFGHHTEMALDPSGDPVLAWLYVDPNADSDAGDTELWWMRWDRAHYVWTAPAKLGVVGDIGSTGLYGQGFRLAVDRTTGAIAIAYTDRSVAATWRIAVLDSADSGATWRNRIFATDSQNYYRAPALALAKGKLHMTFYHDFDGVHYVTGKLADDPTVWSDALAPLLDGTGYGVDSDVAVDSNGDPGVAYLAWVDGGHREMFYRPGSNATVANASADGPADSWQLRLAFYGTNPRIALVGQSDGLYYDDYSHQLFVFTSDDGGATWNPRVNAKSDGNNSFDGPIDVSFNSKGLGAIVTETNSGNSDGVVCGRLKLALSDATGAWTTCGISSTYISGAESPNVQFVANDTMYMAFQTPDYPFDPSNPNEMPAGVYFWRGPIGFTFPAPPPPQQ